MQKCEEKVSIVMPVYNAEKYISEAIESILGQTYDNWELLVVDDCSTDRSSQILQKYAELDKRIKPSFLRQNSGAAAARNEGIKRASGKYLTFLDSDDIWLKDKLKKQVGIMEKEGYVFSFTSYGLMDEQGNQINRKVIAPRTLTYSQALTTTVIWTSTVMLDVSQTGLIEMPLLRAGQDTATWLQILKNIPCAYGIDQILSMYRQVPTSISHNLKRRLKRQWDIYRLVEQFSFIKSMKLYILYILYVLRKRQKLAENRFNL